MDTCNICNAKFGIFNSKFILNDGHAICTKCKLFLGFSYKPDEQKYKAIPFEQILKSYNEKKDLGNYTKKIDDVHAKKTNILICPNCNSSDVSFVQNNKKSFSIGKAAAGAVLTGGIGTLAGFAGKKGKNQWHCKNCGNIFDTK